MGIVEKSQLLDIERKNIRKACAKGGDPPMRLFGSSVRVHDSVSNELGILSELDTGEGLPYLMAIRQNLEVL